MSNTNQNLYDAHNQWRSRPADQRFETLAGLRDSVHGRRIRSRSMDIEATKVRVGTDAAGRLLVNSGLTPSEPTHWSFGQLCAASRINSVAAPSNYMRALPTELAVQCLNEGLQHGDRESHKFMLVAPEDDGPSTLQAVTSTTYGRIWDAEVVDAVVRIVERTNGKFFNPKDWSGKPSGLYASDHDVFAFMIDGGSIVDGGDRAQLNRGFIVWNSETGAKTFGLTTFLFNIVCGNHIIWGAKDINRLIIRHTTGGPSRFDTEATPSLKAYVEASAKPIEDVVRKAQSYLLPTGSDDAIPMFVTDHGKFSRSEIREAINFAKAEEGECRTLWQLTQGFTAYARSFDYIDSRVDLETRAGKLLALVE